MFATNEQLQQAVKGVMDFAATLERGDTLLWKNIEELTGIQRYAPAWTYILKRIRDLVLRDRKIWLRAIPNVGYRLCTKEEQLKECPRYRQRQAIRRLNRAHREVGALPSAELTMHQQQLRAMTLNNLVQERRTVKRGVRAQHAEIKRTETPPRPKRKEAAVA